MRDFHKFSSRSYEPCQKLPGKVWKFSVFGTGKIWAIQANAEIIGGEFMADQVVSYSEILKQLPDGKTHHLLLGNGFSIGCDPRFSYRSLYESSKKSGLSERAQKIFERFGTNNFEAVMRLLDDGHWLAEVYGLVGRESDLKNDLNTLKNVLISSIAESHPDHTGEIDENKKKKAAAFFAPFHNIFSLNYDLLPYWINMSGRPPVYQDGFRDDPDNPDSPSLVFTERMGSQKGIFFVHGALHVFMGEGGLRKHCWARSLKPITNLIREGLENSRYPLFVAEGDSTKKMEQIQASGYLSYCFGKLGRIQNRLVTYGFSFGPSDGHIASTIAENLELTKLYVGVYGTDGKYPDEIFAAVNALVEIRNRILKDESHSFREKHRLEVMFFDSASASVWC